MTALSKIQENSFAEACYNQNSIDQLKTALNEKPDLTDCESWGITEKEWREQIKLALSAKLEDLN